MQKVVKLIDIISYIKSDLLVLYGQPSTLAIHHLKDPENVDAFTLDWVNPAIPDQQQFVESSRAKVILSGKEVVYTNLLKDQNKVLIQVENPKLTLVKIANAFFVQRPAPGIHSTAFIHTEALLGDNVYIGSNASIGHCTIGDNVIIHSNAVIHDEVIIGNDVTLKPGAVLGFDGFGFEKDKSGHLIKFPQLGRLIIKDDVEIGSNTCIDRGSLSDTIIGSGTKINNLCHIAHNVVTGKNVVITAHVNISGSTFIDDDVWIAPNASLRGHQKIGKGAVIGMGAVVTKDVPPGETWIGNPAHKLEK